MADNLQETLKNLPSSPPVQEPQEFESIGPINDIVPTRKLQPQTIEPGNRIEDALYSPIPEPEPDTLFSLKAYKDAFNAAFHTSFEYSAYRLAKVMRFRGQQPPEGIQKIVTVKEAKDEYGIEITEPITYGEAMLRLEMKRDRERALEGVSDQFGWDRPFTSLATFFAMGVFYNFTPTSLALTKAMTKIGGKIGGGGTIAFNAFRGFNAFRVLQKQSRLVKAVKDTGESIRKLEKLQPFASALKRATPVAAANAAEEVGIYLADREAVGDQYGLEQAVAFGVLAPFTFATTAAYLKTLREPPKKPKRVMQADDNLEARDIEKTEVLDEPVLPSFEDLPATAKRIEAQKEIDQKKLEAVKIELAAKAEKELIKTNKKKLKDLKDLFKKSNKAVREVKREIKLKKEAEEKAEKARQREILKAERDAKKAEELAKKAKNKEDRERGWRQARAAKAILKQLNADERKRKVAANKQKREDEKALKEAEREKKKADKEAQKAEEAVKKTEGQVKVKEEKVSQIKKDITRLGKGWSIEGTKDYISAANINKRLKAQAIKLVEGKLTFDQVKTFRAKALDLLTKSENFMNVKLKKISDLEALQKNVGGQESNLKKLREELARSQAHVNEKAFLARLADRAMSKYESIKEGRLADLTDAEKHAMKRSKQVMEFMDALVEKRPLKGLRKADPDIQQFVRRMNSIEKRVPGAIKFLQKLSGATHGLGLKNQDLQKLVPLLDESLNVNKFNKMLKDKISELQQDGGKVTPERFFSIDEEQFKKFMNQSKPDAHIKVDEGQIKDAKKDIIAADIGAGKLSQIRKDLQKVTKELVDCYKGVEKETTGG